MKIVTGTWRRGIRVLIVGVGALDRRLAGFLIIGRWMR